MPSHPSITRPTTALIAATVLDRAFEDPHSVLDLIDRGAPYKTLAAVHRDPPGAGATPWFRNFWALGGKVVFAGAEAAFHNPLYVEAARDLYGAQVVEPLAMMTNFNAPAPAAAPHLDLPFFRGTHRREVPSWLLAPMGYSGLFHRWAIPVASALTWFYDGPGGEFEYWPDGLDASSVRLGDLGGGRAVMADNEYLYHRVCQVGSEPDFLPDNAVPYRAVLDLETDRQHGGLGADRWVIRDGDERLAEYARGEIRVSVLWKAFCFADQAEADAYRTGADDLTPTQVVDIFQRDLRHRGVVVEAPDDLAGDDRWGSIVRETYGAAAY